VIIFIVKLIGEAIYKISSLVLLDFRGWVYRVSMIA